MQVCRPQLAGSISSQSRTTLHVAASESLSPLHSQVQSLTRRDEALSWVAGGIEILVIVSSYNPSGPVSSLVLHVFSARQCSARISMNQSFLFGSFLTLVGTSLRVYCYKTLGRFFTFDLSIKDGHHLVVTGPYSVVRHPSYTALIMTVIGAASIHATGSWVSECASQHPIGRVLIAYWLLAAAAVVLSLLLRLPNEDEMLRNEFGKVWMEWQRQVPYALIPGLY